MEPAPDHPVVLFDGVCNLCSGLVRWIVEHDPDGQFRFASLQSAAGQELLATHGRPTDEFDTFVLIEGEECHTKSGAALRICRRLGLPYFALAGLLVVPRPVRNAAYDLVAASRYRVFGRRDRCLVPGPDLEARFLDGAEPATREASPPPGDGEADGA